MLLLSVLAFLEHVLDGGLVDHQVGSAGAIQLDAVLVVPLDVAVDLFTIAQHDDHGSLRLHLLLVVEIFGVGLLAGCDLLGRSGGAVSVSISISTLGGHMIVSVVVIIERVLGTVEGRTDQLAIREAFLIRGRFSGYGVERIFQIAPPARRAGGICHNTRAFDCGSRGVN